MPPWPKVDVLTLAFSPSLQIASQSALDCSDAAGEVNSILIPHVSVVLAFPSARVTHVVNSEIIQSLGDLNLLLGIEEGIGKLFSLT